MTLVFNMLSVCIVLDFKVVSFVCFYIMYLLERHGTHVAIVGQLARVASHSSCDSGTPPQVLGHVGKPLSC